jgi:hypothetical protein
VVPEEQLPDAVGMNWTIDSVSALIGPSLSGALYAAGRALPFALDAVSYAGSVVSLLFIKSEFQRERAAEPERLWREIAEGLLWLWRHPLLRFLALLVGGLNLFSFGYPIIMIVRAQQLHAGAFAIGLLFATGGAGSILGAMAVGPVQRRFTLGQIMIGGSWIWVITWLPYALAPNLILFGVANAAGWIIIPLFIGTQLSYRLKVIPDELQGRAGSVFKLIAFGGEPISLAMTGVLVQLFGPVTAIVILMVPQLALAIVATLHRDLRRMPCLTDIEVRY